MDRLATMTTFAKVVKYSSFTAAAEDLSISRALVSRHITDLEAHFGVRLLNRTTRSVTPTEAGRRYFEVCTRVLSEILTGEESISTVTSDREAGISILCAKMTGNFDIFDALTSFCRDNPGIPIQINVDEISAGARQPLDEDYDIRIQSKPLGDPDHVSKKICEIEYVLAASPEYLSARGEPVSCDHLADHDCLMQPEELFWCFKDAERFVATAAPRLSSNSFLTLHTAAVGGLGIAMLPRRVTARDLSSGKLCPVLPGLTPESRPLFATYASHGPATRRVEPLIAFLTDWFHARSRSPDDPGRVVELFREARVRGG